MIVELDVKNLSVVRDPIEPPVHIQLAKAIERAMSDLSEIRQANTIQLTVCPGREAPIAFDFNGDYAGFVMQITLRDGANQQAPIPAAEKNTLYVAAFPQYGGWRAIAMIHAVKKSRFEKELWEDVIPSLAREVLTLLAISHA